MFNRKNLIPFMLVAPSVIYMVLFFAYPMFEAFQLAFRDADTGAFTLKYFQTMTNDVQFAPAIITTVLIIIILVPLQFVLAMVMALVLNSKIKGSSLFLYVYAIPMAVSELAAGIVWFNIFTDRGFMNSFLVTSGLLERPFLFPQLSKSLLADFCGGGGGGVAGHKHHHGHPCGWSAIHPQ